MALAETLKFTRGGRGVTRSPLSHGIRATETAMGLRLFDRTARAVALTEAGQWPHLALPPRLAEISAEIWGLMALRETPPGRIRLTLSDDARTVLWP